MRHSITLFATIVSALLLLSSCVKPTVKTFEPEFAIPIANGRLEVIDLLAADTSELVTVDGEGLVAIKYEGGVVKLKGSDFISIPNTEMCLSHTELEHLRRSNSTFCCLGTLASKCNC